MLWHRRSYGRRRRCADVVYSCQIHDDDGHPYENRDDDIYDCEVVGRRYRPRDGLYQRQHARQMGQTQAVYVCGRHFDYRVDIPAVYARERMGRFDKRIYRVYADNVFIMEHLFDVVAGSVLFDVKRHIPVLP